MNNDFSTVIAAMSVEEKVALLTGCGLWRTASLPQHGIPDIVMTDGTYGVRYSSAQIDGNEKWSMDDFISVITQTADQASADEPVAKGGSEALFSASLPATCFP
ncbi:TPA: glycosyl hydrolase, partial [Klebsiella aerogenes]